MAPAQSKLAQNPGILSKLFQLLGGDKNLYRNVISGGVLLFIFYLLKIKKHNRRQKNDSPEPKQNQQKGKSGKGNVDKEFIKRITKILKIVIPSWNNKCVWEIVQLTITLMIRTYLSIVIAGCNGRIVKSIIGLKFQLFLKRLFQLAIISVPASFVNSYIDFLNKNLSYYFRTTLTQHFHSKYLSNNVCYQINNLDSRIQNPDQRLTDDIEKWAHALSTIYSNFTKPIIDIVIFGRELSSLVGWKGPMSVILWYLFSGTLIKFISPPFGKLIAKGQRLEGIYRACITGIKHHSEEIAFFHGNEYEKEKLKEKFEDVIKHQRNVMRLKLYQGTMDSMLTKYGAVLVGYAVLGLPVFGPGSAEYLKKIGNNPANITRDYIRNSSLLINLAKAIGRLVISYKEIQHLAGFTSLITEMEDVLNDLQNNKYQRKQITKEGEKAQIKADIMQIPKNKIKDIENQTFINFKAVPIIAPNSEQFSIPLSIKLEANMNVIVTGPNGCGKSSLFRLLAGLWPIFQGELERPKNAEIVFLPQKPYFPKGTLRDQVIYPDSVEQMKKKGFTDDDLQQLLRETEVEHLVIREEQGWETEKQWKDLFSGGEKQRVSMARLFYHKPQFAVLDECTSAVSADVEQRLYNASRKQGITLFTVTHKVDQLSKYHDYILRFDGSQNYTFEKINN